MPVHSALLAATSSIAALVAALAVELTMSSMVELKLLPLRSSPSVDAADDNDVPHVLPPLLNMLGRGRNQLLLKSKKQRSDQLHEVRKRMSSRTEQ